MNGRAQATVGSGGPLRKVFSNLAWLFGGKGFGAVCSLLYLAILSRSLGLKDFGHFSLIFGTGQALVSIVGFQTWQTMVRYGSHALHEGDDARFGRLAFLCGSIDALGATIGCGIAFFIYYGFGGALDLNPAFVDLAFAFNCALLWSRATAANGIVRVLGRFDVGIYVEGIIPLGRLLAAGLIAWSGANVGRYLFAWAAIDTVAGVVYWVAAWRLAPAALRVSNFGHFRQSVRENSNIVRFMGMTFATSTLDAFYKQGPLLAVGYFLGTSTAGIYRLAEQLAQGFGKLSSLLGRAIYPEIALARVASSATDFRRLVVQITAIAGIGGVVVTIAALLFGANLLALIGGSAYLRGGVILLPLVIAAAFEMASVSYEPVLHSTGHAAYPLIARAIAVVILAVGTFALVGMGPVGIGWAVTIGMASCYAAMSVIVWLVLRRERPLA